MSRLQRGICLYLLLSLRTPRSIWVYRRALYIKRSLKKCTEIFRFQRPLEPSPNNTKLGWQSLLGVTTLYVLRFVAWDTLKCLLLRYLWWHYVNLSPTARPRQVVLTEEELSGDKLAYDNSSNFLNQKTIPGNLWERICKRQFPKEGRQEFEAWREMFERCTTARQKKLDFLSEKLNNSYKNVSENLRRLFYLKTMSSTFAPT